MGISRDSWHKRRLTSGKPKQWRKKKKYELGRVPGNTKLVQGNNAVRRVRCRGGSFKFRALRLDHGNFAWPSQAVTHRTRLLDVTYNATSNEMIRTQSLVKGAIIQIDATPFRQWYERHYGVEVPGAGKHAAEVVEGDKAEKKQSNHVKRKIDARKKDMKALEPSLEAQFSTGRLYAIVTSRPGQCGRCDGYILEGKELEFYARKMQKKKHKAAGAS